MEKEGNQRRDEPRKILLACTLVHTRARPLAVRFISRASRSLGGKTKRHFSRKRFEFSPSTKIRSKLFPARELPRDFALTYTRATRDLLYRARLRTPPLLVALETVMNFERPFVFFSLLEQVIGLATPREDRHTHGPCAIFV